MKNCGIIPCFSFQKLTLSTPYVLPVLQRELLHRGLFWFRVILREKPLKGFPLEKKNLSGPSPNWLGKKIPLEKNGKNCLFNRKRIYQQKK